MLRRSLDEELRSRDALAFPDVIRARLWDAGVSDASAGEPHPGPFLAQKRDGSRRALLRAHLVGAGVRKSVCRAACHPEFGQPLRVLCRWVAALSAA